MIKRNYPLNGLRVFEASARHLSFVKAADELNVTPAAISHQVKRLEEYLHVQLFQRLSRGLQLSEPGQVLQTELQEVFLRLDKAIERVRDRDSQDQLTISVAPMFAVKWLLPRLQHFGVLHPDIDITMSSSLAVVDFQSDGFDAAIRLGQGHYPGLEAVHLFNESVTPMCSPRLIDGSLALHDPEDLSHHVLLHDDSSGFNPAAPNWAKWLEAAGVHIDASRGPHFGQPDHALQAALDGAGVVLGWRYLTADDIAAGRLVAPFRVTLPLGAAFYLVYPEAYANRKKVALFRDWLRDEAQRPSTTHSKNQTG